MYLNRSFTGARDLIDIPADGLCRIARTALARAVPTLLIITIRRAFSPQIETRACPARLDI